MSEHTENLEAKIKKLEDLLWRVRSNCDLFALQRDQARERAKSLEDERDKLRDENAKLRAFVSVVAIKQICAHNGYTYNVCCGREVSLGHSPSCQAQAFLKGEK